MGIYITSDLHFCHNKDFLYTPRGFQSIFEHDKAIIKNWNKVIKNDDLVYILGDLMLNDDVQGRKNFNQLNGNKIIILGNHDTESRKLFYPHLRGVQDIKIADIINYDNWSFYLSHYPVKLGSFNPDRKINKTIYCLCGHTHTTDRWEDFEECKSYHVELDAHNCFPINITDIINDITNYKRSRNL